MSTEEKAPEKGGMMLLFALLEMLDIPEEPAMAQAISKMKDLVNKMEPFSSFNVLRLKLRAMLKVRDEVMLRKGVTNIPSAVGELTLPMDANQIIGHVPREYKPNDRLTVPIGDFLERLLNILEDSTTQSDVYSDALARDIEGLRESKKIQEIQELTEHLILSATNMQEATSVFQAGIGEMATMMYDFKRKVRDLETELEEQKEIALIDKLTGVHNRRAFDMRLEELVAQARRFHTPLCLFLLDMDHFKDINDTYGHDVGDVVLTSFARLLRTSCREYDMVFRFGGDEFAVIFPNEGMEEGRVFADRIQDFMKNNCYRYKDVKINMSVSGGMAQMKEDDDGQTLFTRADKRLYQAKEAGRNRFCFDGTPE